MPILGYRLKNTPRPFFVMPLAVDNLSARVASLCDSHSEAYTYYEQILAAVEHAHKNGVIHRDLKPTNILFLADGGSVLPMVADFGAGRLKERDSTPLTISGWGFGTIGYAAPEQWSDAKNVDERCDIYVLGVILHEMLMGDLPGPVSDMSRLPRGLGYLVERCIQPEPDRRYQSLAELRRDFTMLTSQTHLMEEPAQAAKRLIERMAADSEVTPDQLRELDAIFRDNLDDELLLRGTFPRLPPHVLSAYLRSIPASFKAVLRAYDDAVSGSLGFEYCDVVANFYSSLYRQITESSVREVLLTRLVEMGVSHNRFHVMGAVARIVGSADDAGEVVMVRDVLLNHRDECRALASYLSDVRVPLLRQVIDDLASPNSES